MPSDVSNTAPEGSRLITEGSEVAQQAEDEIDISEWIGNQAQSGLHAKRWTIFPSSISGGGGRVAYATLMSQFRYIYMSYARRMMSFSILEG